MKWVVGFMSNHDGAIKYSTDVLLRCFYILKKRILCLLQLCRWKLYLHLFNCPVKPLCPCLYHVSTIETNDSYISLVTNCDKWQILYLTVVSDYSKTIKPSDFLFDILWPVTVITQKVSFYTGHIDTIWDSHGKAHDCHVLKPQSGLVTGTVEMRGKRWKEIYGQVRR